MNGSRRWAAIDFENPQIVEACDAALKRFDTPPPAAAGEARP